MTGYARIWVWERVRSRSISALALESSWPASPTPRRLSLQLVTLHSGAEAKQGSAERIPLADASVDAVVCAQSFHWFANVNALSEIRRILKTGGVLGLIWNVRDE